MIYILFPKQCLHLGVLTWYVVNCPCLPPPADVGERFSLWISTWLPMDIHLASYGCPPWFLWISTLLPMDVLVPMDMHLASYGFPPWFLWISTLVPMDFHLSSYGFPLGFLWISTWLHYFYSPNSACTWGSYCVCYV